MTSKKKKSPKPFDTAQFERNLPEDAARHEANIRAMLSSKLTHSGQLARWITPPVSAIVPPGVQLLFKFD